MAFEINWDLGTDLVECGSQDVGAPPFPEDQLPRLSVSRVTPLFLPRPPQNG